MTVTQVFTASGTFTPDPWVSSVNVLVVGGGGSGGRSRWSSGGGGAGGVQHLTGVPVTPGVPITVTVGAGGATQNGLEANGNDGNPSAFGAVVALGGGGGGVGMSTGRPGGSGGGGGGNGPTSGTGLFGGAGTAGQGYAGGQGSDAGSSFSCCGGGGGAGAVGESVPTNIKWGGVGGVGVNLSATYGTGVGESGWFGGGGAGGICASTGLGIHSSEGGQGGGGDGGCGGEFANSTAGMANTGGGGGGSGGDNTASDTIDPGAAGGSGIVIVTWEITVETGDAGLYMVEAGDLEPMVVTYEDKRYYVKTPGTLIPEGWDPAAYAGTDPFIWLNADYAASVVTSGGNITEWHDIGPHEYVLTAGTGGVLPVIGPTQNGRTTVRFPANGRLRSATTPQVVTGDYTAFVVFRKQGASIGFNSYPWTQSEPSAAAGRPFDGHGGGRVINDANLTGQDGQVDTASQTTWCLSVLHNSGTSFSEWKDRVLVGTLTGRAVHTHASGQFYLCSRAGEGTSAQMDIAEILIFPALGSIARQTVQDAMRSRWGTP